MEEKDTIVIDDLVLGLDDEEIEKTRDVLTESELNVRLSILVEENGALGGGGR